MRAVLRQLQRTPFDIAAGNPVFEGDIRRQFPAWSQVSLQRASRRAQISASAVLIAAWLLLLWPRAEYYRAIFPIPLVTNELGTSYFDANPIYAAGFEVAVWLAALAFGSGLLLDMLAVGAGLTGISGDVSARRWDLLRLTPLPQSSIVAGKHAVAQLRVWRALAVVVGLRAAAVSALLVSWFVLSGLGMLSDFVLVSPLVAVYVLEPIWRVRSLTALGLVISSYLLDRSLAVLTSGLALAAVWLAQTVIAALMVAWDRTLYRMLSSFRYYVDSYSVYVIDVPKLAGFLFVLSLAAVIVGFYIALRRWSLWQVRRRISRAA